MYLPTRSRAGRFVMAIPELFRAAVLVVEPALMVTLPVAGAPSAVTVAVTLWTLPQVLDAGVTVTLVVEAGSTSAVTAAVGSDSETADSLPRVAVLRYVRVR